MLQRRINAVVRAGEQSGYFAECVEIPVVTQGHTLDDWADTVSWPHEGRHADAGVSAADLRGGGGRRGGAVAGAQSADGRGGPVLRRARAVGRRDRRARVHAVGPPQGGTG